jgi:hypothetical protein
MLACLLLNTAIGSGIRAIHPAFFSTAHAPIKWQLLTI